MSLEQYKTQVLLLHSQQSTLDTLSAGFNDRYSVHCATSGSEALSTLGDTPIHVIVSAQDLPGMSGLEALREARKRSPDTIGILLAGTNKQDGLEALVGDEEVFQIVRGAISPEALIELIESANKRVRLMTLSKSANDQKANVDEPLAEHIVMETSENGAAIISDGTGTLPALNPNRANLAPGVGGREVDVLVLTKDEEFLSTIRDSARGLHNVYHALTPSQAEEIVMKNRVGVLVTDAAMVGSKVEALTQRLRSSSPRVVAIVAGRRDDGELLMDLINRGHVYRFLLKPVSPGRARLAIEASVKHHMEAPDEAFKPKSALAPTGPKPKTNKARSKPAVRKLPAATTSPSRKTTARTDAKPAPNAAATTKIEVRPAPVPAIQSTKSPVPAPKPQIRPQPGAIRKIEPTISGSMLDSPLDGELDQAFGETNSFTETMTGIAMSVGKTISGAKGSVSGSAMGMLDSVGDMSSEGKRPKLLVFGGGGLAIIGIIAWLAMSGGSDPEFDVPSEANTLSPSGQNPASLPSVSQPADQRSSVSELPAAPAANVSLAALLDQARAARDAGNILAPAGDNAVELFIEAAAESGNDPAIIAELNDVVTQVLGNAESAILARNVVDAETALDIAGLADPGNPRLAFLTAQLNELKLRDRADLARVAIREGRYDDAGSLITEVRSLPGDSATEINLLTEELTAARAQQEISATILLANQHLEAGDLVSPANGNARYYFDSVLASDPDNQAAQRGLIAVANKLVLQARDAIDNARLDEADAFLNDARSVDPSSGDLSGAASALTAARQAIANSERQAELARQAELDRQAEIARQAEANRVAEIQRQSEADQLAALERQAEADQLAEIQRQADLERAAAKIIADRREAEAAATATDQPAPSTDSPQGAGSEAQSELTPPAATTVSSSLTSSKPNTFIAEGATTFGLPGSASADNPDVGLQRPPRVAPELLAQPASNRQQSRPSVPVNNAPVDVEMVSISQLTRTNYVGPEYPRSAQRRGVTGSADIAFTITTEGRVREVTVTRSEPGNTFDQAAIGAVEKWRFEPVIENGVTVEKRSAVRLSFDLQ